MLHSAKKCDILATALPATVGGWSLHPGGDFLPPPQEGVMLMLTYSELFQFCLVVIGIIGLFFQAKKK